MSTDTIKCDHCKQQAIFKLEITEWMVEQMVKETSGYITDRRIRSLVATAKRHGHNAIGFKRVTLGDITS